jgi:NSS family neurotransmitter:Na+ symporter
MISAKETFTSRWGLILAGLGMAVGTGNMWRFPRIAAQNGGAAFLIPWIIFLFVWSIPLLITEFGMGRGTRRSVVGAFSTVTRGRFAWMGGFVAVTAIMILFYYSVVTGWTLKYFIAAATGQLYGVEHAIYWRTFTSSVWEPLGYHLVAALVGGYVISRGVVSGIERANKLLIPALFTLLIVAAIRSVTLPGSEAGLEFLFNPDLSSLGNYRTWLEALTQSAWSTGAGWGLIMTYAVYARQDEDVVLNSTTIGFGDNSASLLAGVAILPVVFAVLPTPEALAVMGAGNEGLMFIWIPQLFERVAGGGFFLVLFFLALFFAALSSLIAMIELATRILMDAGMARARAVKLVTAAVIVCGAPSALSTDIFNNQDWVWGLALMLAGLFVALAAREYGVQRLADDFVNVTPGSWRAGRLYVWIVSYLIPVQVALMLGWWVYQAVMVIDPTGWWNPMHVYSLGTCLVQWGLALALLIAFNRKLAAVSTREAQEAIE